MIFELVIPAAASVLLLFTTCLMLVSAIFSWIKGWTMTVFVVVFLAVNFSFNGIGFLAVPNHAYGLDYDNGKAPYSDAIIDSINRSNAHEQKDFYHTLEILDNWRKKHSKKTIATGRSQNWCWSMLVEEACELHFGHSQVCWQQTVYWMAI